MESIVGTIGTLVALASAALRRRLSLPEVRVRLLAEHSMTFPCRKTYLRP